MGSPPAARGLANPLEMKMRRHLRSAGSLATILILVLALQPARLAAQHGARGTFALRPTEVSERIELRLTPAGTVGDRTPVLLGVAVAELRGLSKDDLWGMAERPMHFMVSREAGTFIFQGPVGRGTGRGSYLFLGDDFYRRALARRVFEKPRDSDQARLAAADVSIALVDALLALGYTRPSLRDVIRLGEHGVTDDYVRGLADAGLKLRRVADLLTFRDHGITLDYVADIRRAGYGDAAPMEIVRMKDHGVDAAFLAQLAASGYSSLSVDDAIRAREHGVDSSFAQAFRREGFFQLTLGDLIRLREHGVTAAAARELRDRSRGPLSAEELVQAMERDPRG
jgi:hypothetical protein